MSQLLAHDFKEVRQVVIEVGRQSTEELVEVAAAGLRAGTPVSFHGLERLPLVDLIRVVAAGGRFTGLRVSRHAELGGHSDPMLPHP